MTWTQGTKRTNLGIATGRYLVAPGAPEIISWDYVGDPAQRFIKARKNF